jgi:hypothetical protein
MSITAGTRVGSREGLALIGAGGVSKTHGSKLGRGVAIRYFPGGPFLVGQDVAKTSRSERRTGDTSCVHD